MPRVRIYRSTDYYYLSLINEEQCHQCWTNEEFKAVIDAPTNMVYVAEDGNVVVGYLCYTWTQQYFSVLNIVVSQQYRRERFGTELIDKLKEKVNPPLRIINGPNKGPLHGRNRIVITVRESDCITQFFLKKNRFRYFADDKDYFGDENGYVFKYSLAFG